VSATAEQSERRALPNLARLRQAIIEDLEPELLLACRVACLLAAGHQHTAIARQLGANEADMRVAEMRVKRAAKRLEAPARDELWGV
jgi:hypothetical protein